MFSLSGKISDMIRGGKLPKDVQTTSIKRAPETPSAKAVKSAKGRSMGKGAERRRNGGAS